MVRTKVETTFESRGRTFLLRVEDSSEAADYQKYEDLRNAVWGFPEDHLAGTRNMMCENFLHEGSSLFIGAFVGDEAGHFSRKAAPLAGFCYGFVGRRDKTRGFRDPANLWFYAQYTAVRPEFQGIGLGVRLKEFQRQVLLDHYGVTQVVCTFDPLTAVNAQRNIRHFGMAVVDYRVSTYGEYGGFLNRLDVPTDRFFMAWDLERKPGRPEYDLEAALAAPRPIWTGERRVAGKSSALELEVVEGTDPEAAGDPLLVRIPLDFYRMLQETDVADGEVRRIPLDWRMATRTVFQALFARGYGVVDFRKAEGPPSAHYYVLSRTLLPAR
jgi:predicted GNAT superfamily acetyltransferase